ncbi:MAG: hypothetical protein ABI556_06140 [Gemmatimonadales bacterium]
MAVTRADVPGLIRLAALFLVPLSFAAALATISVLAGARGQATGWPIVIPAALPFLILSYVLWMISPTLRSALPPAIMERGVWGLVLVLSLVPWPLLRAKNSRDATMRTTYEAAAKAEEDSLAQSLESMTGDDMAMMMYELRNLGLDATPALCRSTNDFLANHAESFRGKAATTERYEIEGSAIEKYLFAMEWLTSNRCDITRAIDAYDGVVRLYPAAPDREQFLARLAAMRQASR